MRETKHAVAISPLHAFPLRLSVQKCQRSFRSFYQRQKPHVFSVARDFLKIYTEIWWKVLWKCTQVTNKYGSDNFLSKISAKLWHKVHKITWKEFFSDKSARRRKSQFFSISFRTIRRFSRSFVCVFLTFLDLSNYVYCLVHIEKFVRAFLSVTPLRNRVNATFSLLLFCSSYIPNWSENCVCKRWNKTEN